MKTKKLNKKLALRKRTISNLNNAAMSDIKGGDIYETLIETECFCTGNTNCVSGCGSCDSVLNCNSDPGPCEFTTPQSPCHTE